MVVSVCLQSLCDKIIGKFPGLLEAVDAFGDFEVHPTVVDVLFKVVLVNEFLWDLADTNADIFWAIEQRFEVEVGKIRC